MDNYQYTQNWFLNSEIKATLLDHFTCLSNKRHILEIGSFEGLSSVFFADNLLENPESSLTCVDPFSSLSENDHKEWLQQDLVEKRFIANISSCNNNKKIKAYKTTSDLFFQSLSPAAVYDLVYIDGCHVPEQIRRDLLNSFRHTKVNGYIWMDDYRGNPEITSTIDSVLEGPLKGRYYYLHRGYQLAIVKTH